MPSETIAVSMGWRLPDESWVLATYNSRVVAYEADKDRWLVVLEDLDTASRDLSRLDASTRLLIRGISGKWAYVPDAARDGVTLPLKYDTLTGRIRFFYTSDPRLQARSRDARINPADH